jgi:predicted DNA-binding transcriptional regulator AlpA
MEQPMKDNQTDLDEDIPDLLADWISREQLARALGLTADTLSRWEARRQGPPCTRIGRRTFYRRAAIQEWIRAQEQAHPGRKTRGAVMTIQPHSSAWPADRVAEARAVIADVAHHSDLLIRLACNVLVQHGETPGERADAQRLLVVVDARRPVRRAQREDQGRAAR